MGEEAKKECGCAGGKGLATLGKVILGLVFVALAVYLMVVRHWWNPTWYLIKGCAGPFLLLAALVTFAIAKE
jgi:hypothetical protein